MVSQYLCIPRMVSVRQVLLVCVQHFSQYCAPQRFVGSDPFSSVCQWSAVCLRQPPGQGASLLAATRFCGTPHDAAVAHLGVEPHAPLDGGNQGGHQLGEHGAVRQPGSQVQRVALGTDACVCISTLIHMVRGVQCAALGTDECVHVL